MVGVTIQGSRYATLRGKNCVTETQPSCGTCDEDAPCLVLQSQENQHWFEMLFSGGQSIHLVWPDMIQGSSERSDDELAYVMDACMHDGKSL